MNDIMNQLVKQHVEFKENELLKMINHYCLDHSHIPGSVSFRESNDTEEYFVNGKLALTFSRISDYENYSFKISVKRHYEDKGE